MNTLTSGSTAAAMYFHIVPCVFHMRFRIAPVQLLSASLASTHIQRCANQLLSRKIRPQTQYVYFGRSAHINRSSEAWSSL